VDVGALDAVVCCGYPGSVASIWQQWGRAGRGKDPSLAVYIAGRDFPRPVPLREPRPASSAAASRPPGVTMENPYILGPHLLAAAHEAPLDAETRSISAPLQGCREGDDGGEGLARAGER
jgi:DEAD/DEAH box helicase domain-containing protein